MENLLIFVIISSFISLSSTIGYDLSPDQKIRCEQYPTLFESNSIHFDYGFCRDLNDGNGFTAGRSHFTTRSGDALEVVRRYTFWKPFNSLAQYEPELQRIKDLNIEDVSRLKGFCKEWRMASHDPLFSLVQDKVNDDLYYIPAIRLSANLHLRTPLSKCVIYDTIAQHGLYKTVNTFKSIISHNEDTGKLVSEKEEKWIRFFLKLRRITLEEHNNREAVNGWKESTDRVDAFLDLIQHRNWNLEGPITFADDNQPAIVVEK